MSESLSGVVVTHGDLGVALVNTVERITGIGGALQSLSNEGLDAEALWTRIAEACPPGPTIVFVDLAGGSCGMAGLGLRHGRTDLAVLTGVNVPMLIEFVFHLGEPIESLVPRLERKACEGISAHACRAGTGPHHSSAK